MEIFQFKKVIMAMVALDRYHQILNTLNLGKTSWLHKLTILQLTIILPIEPECLKSALRKGYGGLGVTCKIWTS